MGKATIYIINKKPDEEPIEVVYKGSYSEGKEHSVVEYDESDLTGMEGIRTRINIYQDHMEIVRTGNLNARLKFKEGYIDSILYKMQYGTIAMEVSTEKLDIRKVETGYDILVRYDLEVKGDYKDKNDMSIRIVKS
jgi:uncharacterized beta-barrel protein YwiB (DUF1934 family)